MHGVKPHGETGRKQGTDRREIKQCFHQRLIISHRIDDMDLHIAVVGRADAGQINVIDIDSLVVLD